jgi:hypothetical protein
MQPMMTSSLKKLNHREVILNIPVKNLRPHWYYVWPSKGNQKSFVFLAKQLEKFSGQSITSFLKLFRLANDSGIVLLFISESTIFCPLLST